MITEKAHATARRKIRMASRRAKLHLPIALPGLFALTDPDRTPDPLALARGLPRGSGIIYRHFGADDRLSVALGLSRIARTRKLTLLIGNDPALACRVGADGVHWSEQRRPEARKWRTRFSVMTCAAHSRRALAGAIVCPCNAALYSTVFASKSASASNPVGALRFRSIAGQSRLPVYALGGVTSDTINRVAAFSGGAGIEGLSMFARLD